MSVKFSILLSIYHREDPRFLNIALESIWDHQILKPSEIVLVEDGKLTDELYNVIAKWQEKLGDVLKVVPLETNQGLGKALNIGLQYCTHDIVARMDTDDIATPDRFSKQLQAFLDNPELDIVGGQIREFEKEIGDIPYIRNLPLVHDEIFQFAKKRCPFNHPAVMYRKSAVIAAGGYQDDHLYEDYALWIRMLMNHAKTINLPDVILNMRSGTAMFERRGGLSYAKSEYKVQTKFFKQGFLTFPEYTKNLIIRLPVRIMPNQVRGFIYKTFLRNKG